MDQIVKIIKELIRSKFWGEIRIKFQDGKITVVKKEEQIKII